MRAISLSVLLLAGCAGLPRAGPVTGAIVQDGAAQGYQFTTLTGPLAAALAPPPDTAATGFYALGPPAALGRIAIGDPLQITLWEPNPTGTTLLEPPGLQTVLRVDPSGCILLPYAGTIQAAGRTPLAVQSAIMSILARQGHSIQASVLDTQTAADSAVIGGEIARPGAYPLNPGSRSLLDLIAIAGGPRQTDGATLIRLTRGGLTAEAPLTAITADASLDIPLAPGDDLTLIPRNRVFYAFGAVNHPGLFPYDEAQISLVQALAETAGLQDNLAAPRGVFIFRASAGAAAQKIYQLDLSQPAAFFTAGRFIVAPDDIIYVSDAPVADVSKVLQTISGVGNIAVIPRNFGAPY